MPGPLIETALLSSRLFYSAQSSAVRQNTGESNYPKAMPGGALSAASGELPYLNRTVKPAGDSAWAKLIAYITKYAIQNGTDWWIHKHNPDDKEQNLD